MSEIQELQFDNLTVMDYQPDTAFSNYLYGINNNLTLDFDNSNYNLIIDNLSKALNISPENLSNYVNDSSIQIKERNYREALTLISIITVFYAIIFVSGIIGNLITCIVISRNKYMHTATNFYLFNLAISDLLLLLSGLPQEIYSLWHPRSYPFTDFVCILESTLLETAANVTVLTITAFSVERYIAICHPFRQHSMSKLSRAIKFILAIWMTAFILALPQAMQFAVIAEHGSTSCTLKNWFYGHVFAVSGCVFFVGPMTAICVLYVLIGIKLKKSKLLQGVKRYDRGISAQTRVIRMLVAVAVAFFLCWAPFHAQRLMAVYGSTVENPSKLFKKVFPVLNHVSGVMYYLSTCINPLLYNIMSHKFRNAFKLTLARQCGLFRSYQTQNNNYYSALPRQNGSMRLNMSTLDHRTTVMQLNKRESDLSLLQDNNISNSRRLSMRSGSMGNQYRCVSVSSQSTLMTTLSKNDIYSTVTNVTPNRNHHSVNSYCNNNSINYNSNRPLNIGNNSITIQESKNSYNNNCSSNPITDDMQISSLDDNLDEMADCHRLKNVQRYQQNVTTTVTVPSSSSQSYFHNHNQVHFTTDTNKSIINKENYHHQLPVSAITMLAGQTGKPITTVSVIVPTKKIKYSSQGNNNYFRKSFESHPNSMMSLNNGTSPNSIINSNNLKEFVRDHSNHNKCHNENINNKDYDTINRNNNSYSCNTTCHPNDNNISGNNSISCSCSSNNSSYNDINKCDKLSFPSSNTSTKLKLNNEFTDLNKILQLKQNDGIAINIIKNILIDNNLTKSNSFNNLVTKDPSQICELQNKNLIQQQTTTTSIEENDIIPNDIIINSESIDNNCDILNNDMEIERIIPSTNINNCNKNFLTLNKDNNSENFNTTNSSHFNRIDSTNNKSLDDFKDLDRNIIKTSDSDSKINILKTVKVPVVPETTINALNTKIKR